MASDRRNKEKNNGQGETARQPGDTQAQGGEGGSRSAGVAFRAQGSVRRDDPVEAKVTTRTHEATATFARATENRINPDERAPALEADRRAP